MSHVRPESVVDLRRAAVEASSFSYAPYTGYSVGAAAIDSRGRITSGCKVECSSFGLTLCAEVVLIGKVVSEGSAPPVMISCRDADGAVLMPCGRCRQMLFEHFGPECLVDRGDDELPLRVAELLPHARSGMSQK